jgi:DNA polymerase III subunit epsilon
MVIEALKPAIAAQGVFLSLDLINFYRQISQQTLTIVDVETTGVSPHRCRVIEVSVLQASLERGIHWQQTHLINPQVLVPEQITQFTGITQAMVDAAPAPSEVWPGYQEALQTGVLTAHNLNFDYGFLRSEYQHLGLPYTRPPEQQFCTVKLARLLLADLPSRSLPNLVQHFGFQVGAAHRAESDTLACWLLAKHLLTQIQDTPEAKLLRQLDQTWISLEEAALILGCEVAQAGQQLADASLPFKSSRRSQTTLYRRGSVEKLAQRR